MVSIMDSARAATEPSISSTSRVASLRTGSPYCRMVRPGTSHSNEGPGRPRPQMAVGSTSTRSPRPLGRGTAPSRSQRVAWSGAWTRYRPSGKLGETDPGPGPPAPPAPAPPPARRAHRAVAGRRSAAATPRRAARGRSGEGGQPGAPAHRLLGRRRRRPARPPPRPAGPDDRAPWSARGGAPRRGPAWRGPTMREARTKQRQGFVGGAEAGCQQVEVDVEEHHRGGAADPVQHRFGADEDPRVGNRCHGPRPRTDRTPRPPRRREVPPAPLARRVTPARSVFIRNRPQAAQTSGRSLWQRGQRSPVPSCATAAPHVGALRQLAAVRAGQQAGPSRPVVEAHERPPARGQLRVVEHGTGQAHELVGEHAAARVRRPPVHAFDGRPSGSLHADRQGHDRSPGGSPRRAGRGR